MAVNFTDFTNAPVTKSPLRDLLSDVLSAYQAPKKAAQAQEAYELQKRQQELANKFKETQIENEPGKQDLEKRYKEALIKAAEARAQGGSSGLKPSGDVANALYIKGLENKLGEDHPDVIAAKKAQDLGNRQKESNIKTRETYSNSAAFRGLPVNEKARQIAWAVGAGFDPGEAEKEFYNGKTISDLAKEKGIDPKLITPIYPVGQELIKQTQSRGALQSELANLEQNTAAVMGKYQNKLKGYSVKQVADALANKNPDEQGMLLAARALQPEIAALRLKVAGGNIGIEALREMVDKSLGNLKVFETAVSPEAYTAMSKYINQYLAEANQVYTKGINDYGRLGNLGGQQQTAPITGQAPAQGGGRVWDAAKGGWSNG